LGFGFVWFFGLGCFSLVVCVWEAGLVHTAMLDSMLAGVGVSVGYVGFFVSVLLLVVCSSCFLGSIGSFLELIHFIHFWRVHPKTN
jgi:hypothetical protein